MCYIVSFSCSSLLLLVTTTHIYLLHRVFLMQLPTAACYNDSYLFAPPYLSHATPYCCLFQRLINICYIVSFSCNSLLLLVTTTHNICYIVSFSCNFLLLLVTALTLAGLESPSVTLLVATRSQTTPSCYLITTPGK